MGLPSILNTDTYWSRVTDIVSSNKSPLTNKTHFKKKLKNTIKLNSASCFVLITSIEHILNAR